MANETNEKKYASLNTLQTFLDNLKTKFATITHKHTMSDITDYTEPTVDTTLSSTSTNAVANSIVATEIDNLNSWINAASNGLDASKANIDLSNVDDTTFKAKAESAGIGGGGIPIVTATSTDGTSYTATVNDLTSLDVGTRITIVPNRNSASTSPTLNINSLGDYSIQMPITFNSYATSVGTTETWLVADTPITLMYNGECWLTVDMPRTSAQYLYGTVPVSSGGTGQTSIADTAYTTARYRASSLHSTETTPSTNGVICWTYE